MRLSIEPGDPGFHPPDRRLVMVVRLDGRMVCFPLTADTDAGFVRYYAERALPNGSMDLDRNSSGDPMICEAHGQVTITPVSLPERMYIT